MLSANYTQISGPSYPLGAHLCLVGITADTAYNIRREWCDSTNASIASEEWRVPQTAGGPWMDNQPTHSRLWAAQVFTGLEYDVSSPRATRTLASDATSLDFQRRSTMLSSQRVFNVTELFSLRQTAGGLTMRVQLDEPPLDATFTFVPAGASVGHPASLRPPEKKALQSPLPSPLQRAAAVAPAPVPKPWSRGGLAPKWFSLKLSDAWLLSDSALHDNVLAISLQGLANRQHAALYLEYPADWAYGYTADVREWVASSRGQAYEPLASLSDALAAFASVPRGYVLWDPHGTASARGSHNSARQSLLVAFTAAGQLGALVATSAHVPALRAMGLPLLADYSSVLRNMSDAEAMAWAKERWWANATKDELMWMGGECDMQVRPAQADVGVMRGLFFTDLSTLLTPQWADENALADDLIAEAADSCERAGGNPLIVLGWHSYCKDYEHTFITMASRHGARNHGLNTNPNLSFMSQLALPHDFTFKNRPPPAQPSSASSSSSPPPSSSSLVVAAPGAASAAKLPRVAMTFVQTDGLGLGAWSKAGRGSIPYSWEVTLPDLEIQPAILQMFYEQATQNDTFVACLSGPGYLYPKAVPSAKLPGLLRLAGASMRTLDLHAMVAFDASAAATASHTVTGDCTLSAEVVAAYAAHLPEARAILNGYGPTFTFASSRRAAAAGGGNLSTVSFDYYLDPSGTVASIAADLATLGEINDLAAPYLLAVHVREWSTVGRVAQVLAQLPAGFALLPVHEWIPIANAHPTFRPRYR